MEEAHLKAAGIGRDDATATLSKLPKALSHLLSGLSLCFFSGICLGLTVQNK